jgi:hypothetical protein
MFFSKFLGEIIKKSVVCVNPEVGNSISCEARRKKMDLPKLGSGNEKKEVEFPKPGSRRVKRSVENCRELSRTKKYRR